MTCSRCTAPTSTAYVAVLRRLSGRGHVRSNPEAFCPPCAVTAAALLAPARLERVS